MPPTSQTKNNVWTTTTAMPRCAVRRISLASTSPGRGSIVMPNASGQPRGPQARVGCTGLFGGIGLLGIRTTYSAWAPVTVGDRREHASNTHRACRRMT